MTAIASEIMSCSVLDVRGPRSLPSHDAELDASLPSRRRHDVERWRGDDESTCRDAFDGCQLLPLGVDPALRQLAEQPFGRRLALAQEGRAELHAQCLGLQHLD